MKKWLVWGIYITIGLLLLVAGSLFMIFDAWNRAYERQMNRLKKKGVPTTPEAVQHAYRERHPDQKDYSNYPVPEELKKVEKAYYDLQWQEDKSKREAARAVRDRVNRHEGKIQELLREDPVHAKLQVERGMNIALPHVDERNSEARVLSLYALVKHIEGDGRNAIRALRKGYRIAEKLRGEPSPLSFWVHLSITRLMNNTLKEVVSSADPLHKSYRKLFPYLRKEFVRSELEFTLTGELSTTILTLKEISETSSSSSSRAVPETEAPYFAPEPLRRKWTAGFVRGFLNWKKELVKPYYRGIDKLNRLREALQKNTGGWFGYLDLLASLRLPSLLELAKAIVRSAAKTQLLRIAIDWRLRQQQGNGEGKLPDLSKTVDPATGEPYKLTKNGDTFKIYSLGPDQEDDGGKNSSYKTDEDDEGVRLPLPK